MSEGDLIRKVQPAYPALARSARVQGIVVLQAMISKQGTIENLRILTGHPMLAPAAVEAVRQWRYRPYILNGEPVEVETQITVNFALGGN
jgi:protein TonB